LDQDLLERTFWSAVSILVQHTFHLHSTFYYKGPQFPIIVTMVRSTRRGRWVDYWATAPLQLSGQRMALSTKWRMPSQPVAERTADAPLSTRGAEIKKKLVPAARVLPMATPCGTSHGYEHKIAHTRDFKLSGRAVDSALQTHSSSQLPQVVWAPKRANHHAQ